MLHIIGTMMSGRTQAQLVRQAAEAHAARHLSRHDPEEFERECSNIFFQRGAGIVVCGRLLLWRLLNGRWSNDQFFNRDLWQQRAIVASHMNLSPDRESWPLDIIDRKIHLRRTRGEQAYHEELTRMFCRR